MIKENQSAKGRLHPSGAPCSPGSFSARLWAFWVCLILYATMWPFQVEWPPHSAWERITQGYHFTSRAATFADFLQNIMLFVPFGFLGYISLRNPKRIRKLVLLGILFSVSIESIQVLLLPRTPALVDVAANSVGSLLGALTALVLSPYVRIFVLGLKETQYQVNFAIGVWVLFLIGLGVVMHERPDVSVAALSPMENFVGYAVLSALCSGWYAKAAFRWGAIRGPLSAVGVGFVLLTLENIPAFPCRTALPIAGIWLAAFLGGLLVFTGCARLPRSALAAVFCGTVLILDRGLLRYHTGLNGPDGDQVLPFVAWMERFLMYFAFGFGLGWVFPKPSFGMIKIAAAGVLLGLLSQVLLGNFNIVVSGLGAAGLGAVGGAWVWKEGELAFAAYVNRIRSMRKTVSRYTKGVDP